MALERRAERSQMLRTRPGWWVWELRREHDRREERGGGQVRDAERVAHEMARGPQLRHDPLEAGAHARRRGRDGGVVDPVAELVEGAEGRQNSARGASLSASARRTCGMPFQSSAQRAFSL